MMNDKKKQTVHIESKQKMVNQRNCVGIRYHSFFFLVNWRKTSTSLFFKSVIVYLLNRFFKLSRFFLWSVWFSFTVKMHWMVVNGCISVMLLPWKKNSTWNALASIFQHNFTKYTRTSAINIIRRVTYFPGEIKSSLNSVSFGFSTCFFFVVVSIFFLIFLSFFQ